MRPGPLRAPPLELELEGVVRVVAKHASAEDTCVDLPRLLPGGLAVVVLDLSMRDLAESLTPDDIGARLHIATRTVSNLQWQVSSCCAGPRHKP